MSQATRADVCAVAVAECFRNDGEIMVSPMGLLPALGARLAKRTFSPDIVLTDGVSKIIANVLPLGRTSEQPIVEGWMPYRAVFDTLWWGQRHVMMGASQIDRYGNQNISCIGPFEKPKNQLLGARGAPGNTINHTTSYFVGKHDTKVFVERVDMVSGVGYDRAAKLPEASRRFHRIHNVVTNLAVLDFDTADRTMRLVSVHPGVTVDDVVKATGFPLAMPSHVPQTRLPTDEELRILRELDPEGIAAREVAS